MKIKKLIFKNKKPKKVFKMKKLLNQEIIQLDVLKIRKEKI